MTDSMPDAGEQELIASMRRVRQDFTRMMKQYEFAIKELLTKVEILRDEFVHLHRYNPIEHIGSRLKTPASVVEKAQRKGLMPSPDVIREHITDVAGVRITCSFIADTYRVLEALTAQDDVTVLQVKDYIADPKPNGYKSLHAIVEVPVFLSDGPVPVVCEVQIRTIAMDFWASLEHKIHYKYAGQVPDGLAEQLLDAARTAEELDRRMERLHDEVVALGGDTAGDALEDEVLHKLWQLVRDEE